MTVGLIRPLPAVLVPRPLEELVDLSELDESGASDEGRRPAWIGRIEPCACGGEIVAATVDTIQAAVVLHQQTLEHQLYRGERNEELHDHLTAVGEAGLRVEHYRGPG